MYLILHPDGRRHEQTREKLMIPFVLFGMPTAEEKFQVFYSLIMVLVPYVLAIVLLVLLVMIYRKKKRRP
jgi:NADH:ubiquinone oxidoreductase subunit K